MAEKNRAVTCEFLPAATLAIFETLRMAIHWREPHTLRAKLPAPSEALEQALYAEDRDGKTLLGLAVELKMPAMIRILVGAGAEVDLLMGGLSQTALHKACLTGCVESIGVLLDAGADLECPHPINGNTPLMACIGNRHEEAALYLIERGARVDMDQCNLGGSTVADFASVCDSPAVFFKIVEKDVFAGIPAALELAAARGAGNIMRAAAELPEWRDVMISDTGIRLLEKSREGPARESLQSVRIADQVGCAVGSAGDGSPAQVRARAVPSL